VGRHRARSRRHRTQPRHVGCWSLTKRIEERLLACALNLFVLFQFWLCLSRVYDVKMSTRAMQRPSRCFYSSAFISRGLFPRFNGYIRTTTV
jgi:hypothetical protein